MGSLVARLKNGKAAKQIVLLSSGSLIAQLLTFAMSPVLTRLYSTEVIGLFTFVLSIVSAFSGVICLRYDVSIVTADKESFGPLFKACVIITVALSLLIGVGSFVVCWLFEMVEPSSLWTIVFVFPLLLVAGAINILNGCNNRNEEYKAISDAYVGRSVAQNAIMVGAGLVAPNAAVLLVSQLVGQFAGIKLQLRALHDSWKDALRVDSDAVRRAVVDNRAQALFSTPATLLNAASYSLVSLCIGNVYGMGVLGLYSISFRVLGVPLAVFSSNIARVHCKLSEREMGSSGSYFKSTLKMLLASFAIILPISALLFFFSPPGLLRPLRPRMGGGGRIRSDSRTDVFAALPRRLDWLWVLPVQEAVAGDGHSVASAHYSCRRFGDFSRLWSRCNHLSRRIVGHLVGCVPDGDWSIRC